MKTFAQSKIVSMPRLLERLRPLRQRGKTIVFTNGCFDLLHAGHLACLEFAAKQGDVLVVGINADDTIRRLKGPTRPIVPADQRAMMLAGLAAVDFVFVFDEHEPAVAIRHIVPDVLVKGADAAQYVSGRNTVEAAGGRVILTAMVEGLSTSHLVSRICATRAGVTV